MSDNSSGSASAERGLAGADQSVASFDEGDVGIVRKLQSFLHLYPTSIPFIVLLVGVAIFSVAAPGEVLRPVQLLRSSCSR